MKKGLAILLIVLSMAIITGCTDTKEIELNEPTTEAADFSKKVEINEQQLVAYKNMNAAMENFIINTSNTTSDLIAQEKYLETKAYVYGILNSFSEDENLFDKFDSMSKNCGNDVLADGYLKMKNSLTTYMEALQYLYDDDYEKCNTLLKQTAQQRNDLINYNQQNSLSD